MIHQGTDWNRHHGVGATLLENWVEERAIGDVVIQERSDIAKLSRNGHKDILTHPGGNRPTQTTTKEAYAAISRPDPSKVNLGKRRQLMEAELLKLAIKSQTEPLQQPSSSKEWLSTTKDDFSHSDVYGPLNKLGESPLDKYARPITFWTDFAAKGSGTAICSTPATVLHARGHGKHVDDKRPVGARCRRTPRGQVHQHHASPAAIRFGKHSAFSTPIQDILNCHGKE
ncbi:hypothetical protein BC831DRAFT_397471 [Entophlyctis helioformis]|nr:hypothetical protein BC831DRAFT_397471 [Entophlyctis helioformis]